MIRNFRFRLLLIVLAVMVVVILPGTRACASSIQRLELTELADRAQVIALAKVMKVEKKLLDSRKPAPYDEVTIRVASVIKGRMKQNKVKVILQPRGVKDFDPTLKVGDTGVFFLREVSESKAKLAYWGSVAVFVKPNFVASGKSGKPKEISVEPKKVKLETTMGSIIIELNEKAAPVTVKNFLGYVEEGFFDGIIFHRVIPNFMIQAGGFTADMKRKTTHAPIVNEADNGLKNVRGAIAMARTNNPDSATSQFFINHKNNDGLNYVKNRNPGYAVFGKVVEGMDVVDSITAVKTTRKGGHSDVPVNPVVIKSARIISDK